MQVHKSFKRPTPALRIMAARVLMSAREHVQVGSCQQEIHRGDGVVVRHGTTWCTCARAGQGSTEQR